MTLLEKTCAAITAIDHETAVAAQHLLDGKTKPRRSLGRLEDLACKVAAIQRNPRPPLPTKAIVVMAGDHGVTQEGVSAYPPEVTWQMLLNFARGGAAINVLARQAAARLIVVDMGVNGPVESIPGVLSRRIAPGTRNFTRGPAMTVEQTVLALEHGITIAQELASTGVDLLGIGEMGIGNTTAATALVAAFTGRPALEITGRGTGIDDDAFARKVAAIERGLTMHPPSDKSALQILVALGGFEIAGLAGVVLGAAARGIPVLLDGFIASTAALCAARLAPRAADYVIASHRSVEIGHKVVLEALGCEPLFDFSMRLGEGTGAALAMHMVDAALHVLHEMATFESAQVTDTGR
jgi:nicotinate-nucleotide--dimethylbenzimidazole phosphoribosyltransferase